jgi:hypothetical protein
MYLNHVFVTVDLSGQLITVAVPDPDEFKTAYENRNLTKAAFP